MPITKKLVIDTNYIVRYLVRDIEEEYQLAKNLFEDLSAELRIPTIVMAETVYILENHYKIRKEEAISAIELIIMQPNIDCEKFIFDSLQIYKNSNISYYDSLILAETKNKGYQLKSLDKKLSSLSNR